MMPTIRRSRPKPKNIRILPIGMLTIGRDCLPRERAPVWPSRASQAIIGSGTEVSTLPIAAVMRPSFRVYGLIPDSGPISIPGYSMSRPRHPPITIRPYDGVLIMSVNTSRPVTNRGEWTLPMATVHFYRAGRASVFS